MSSATGNKAENRRSYAPIALGLATMFTNASVEDGHREWFEGASSSVSDPSPTFRVLKQVTIPDSPAGTPSGYTPLEARVLEMALDSKTQFARLSAEVGRLAGRVDELASALSGSSTDEDDYFVLPEDADGLFQRLGSDFAAPPWATWFDAVADANAQAPYVADLALRALSSSRGSVRAAAARALATASEATAADVLPEAISRETNRFAASVMEAALAAARA